MRIEPAASVAWANGTMPAATAAAAPPLDPPEPWATFQGLRVGPHSVDSVVPLQANSGVAVRPRVTSPASRKRRISSESAAAVKPCASRLPNSFFLPAIATPTSLIRKGTPARGEFLSRAGATSARSGDQLSITALIRGLSCAHACSAASASSRGLTSPCATRLPSPIASYCTYSESFITVSYRPGVA